MTRDYPIEQCLNSALPYLQKGATIYQKWTCAKCGERVTSSTPNIFFEQGRHDEKTNGEPCGHVTNIREQGCNWLLHMGIP